MAQMTGLDIQTDRIIEIAAIATDADLNELDNGKRDPSWQCAVSSRA
jgi:oligoribonuclease (3'-5' exoribonuclease)